MENGLGPKAKSLSVSCAAGGQPCLGPKGTDATASCHEGRDTASVLKLTTGYIIVCYALYQDPHSTLERGAHACMCVMSPCLHMCSATSRVL